MSNMLFNMFGNSGNSGPMGMIKQFQQFRQQMSGKDPREEINRLLQSGKISQEQLDHVQQMARQMQGLFR